MAKPRGAGDLRQRVRFERRQTKLDDYGSSVDAWVDLGCERSCSLQPARGGEDVQAGRISGRATWDCWVRSDSGTRTIRTGDRAVDANDLTRTFNVVFVGDMDERRQWLLIQMTSGGPNG